MAVKFEEIKEYNEDGVLRYEEVICSPTLLSKEESKRVAPCGTEWVRVGRNAAYWPNGHLRWVLNYDNHGNLIKEDNPSYRQDGSIVIR